MGLTRSFGERTEPLNTEQRQKLVESAVEDGTAVERFAVFLYLYTGLRPYAGTHLRSSMVHDTQHGIKIVLPPGTHKCSVADATGHIILDWNEPKTVPCNRCKNRGGHEFESPRSIPVRDDTAVQVLSGWFDLYDRTPHVQTLRRHLKNIGKKAGIERDVTPVVLRHSFGVLLTEKQFTRKEIHKLMGYQDDFDLGSRFSLQVLGYADYAEGENPYLCGAETSDGTQCCKGSPVGEKCFIHQSQFTCDAETLGGDICKNTVSGPDKKCHHHQKND